MFQLKKALTRALPASFVVLAAHGGVLAQEEITPEPPAEGTQQEHVDLATKWKVDDADPMASIPSLEERNGDPLEFGYYLQDMLFRAEGAYRASKWQDAARYYKALSVAVPNVARSYSRMCDSYARLGESVLAIESCRTAIGMAGAKVIDHVRYVDLLLRKPSFGATDRQDVTASLDHLRQHANKHPQALPSGQPAAAKPAAPELAVGDEPVKRKLTPEEKAVAVAAEQEAMRKRMREMLEGDSAEPELLPAGGLHLPTQIEFSACRLAVRTGDAAAIPQCTARLREYKIPEKALLPFFWAEALQRRDETRSAALLEEARKSGVSPEVLASMLGEQEQLFGAAWSTRLKQQWAPWLGLAALVLSGLTFFGFYRVRSVRSVRAALIASK